MLIGYMRVSTSMQDYALQRDALVRAGVAEGDIYEDTITGTSVARDGLGEALARLGEGDTLVVWRMDRLGRTVRQLKDTVEALEQRGVGFRSLKENIDTSSPAGRLFFHMLASFAEFERDVIAERTKAGVAAARAQGVHCGRPAALSEEEQRVIADQLAAGYSMRKVAEAAGTSLSMVKRIADRNKPAAGEAA